MWEGGRKVTSFKRIKSPVALYILRSVMARRVKWFTVTVTDYIVFKQQLRNSSVNTVTNSAVPLWTPPQVEHFIKEI